MKSEKFWERILSKGETLEYEFTISRRFRRIGIISRGSVSLLIFLVAGATYFFLQPIFRYTFYFVIILVLTGVIFFLWALFYYEVYIKNMHTYALTDRRIIIHTGWFSTSTESISYSEITDILVEETFFERTVMKVGTLFINTAGTADYEVVLRNIDEPHEVKKKMDELKIKSQILAVRI